MTPADSNSEAVAIVGMDGRFPGARNLAEFWQNLREGVESISFFSNEELLASGVDPELLAQPNYVKARALIDDTALFDAAFFGYTPREAAHMDPQQRLFLECSWHALEHAGCDPARHAGAIGVFAGAYLGTYLLANIAGDPGFIPGFLAFREPGHFQTSLGNDKDFLTSRVAYKLNLRGPAITVQTACSTSLVAVCQAVHSLLTFQCDMALAGGVCVTFPERKGYLHEEGGILSPDGHCRAFDASAHGTVFGSGLGVVVLKRLSEALADGDHIHAVIKAAALNNDGSNKVSYTAPSIEGQAEAIALAHSIADITADTISYVEAHGTGTLLGDPIEVAALTQAFRETTGATGFCGLGSVKTNIGHLDAAAGVAGLIKTTLALEHRELPPSLHFTTPNPNIDFASSPFRVVEKRTPWETKDGIPRRAAVSSFGVGGTNAHVVLEEAPPAEPSSPSPRKPLFLLSAKTGPVLREMSRNLAAHIRANPDLNLADAAFTLQTGRQEFACRRAATDIADLEKDAVLITPRSDVPVVFVFPGQGAQTLRMGAGLYKTEPVFRAALDRCADLLAPHLGLDLRAAIMPPAGADEAAATALLNETRITQPALFAVEWAIAQLWISWGIRPVAMLGHSVGEYVAACIAGVLPLEDALALIAGRARLVQEQPGGSMLAVKLPEAHLAPRLTGSLAIAAINAPTLCVVSGPTPEVAALEAALAAENIACRMLATSHAFHSPMMEPAVEPFRDLAARVEMQPPTIPFASCMTGKWITDAEATDPSYWASHLRQPVRFAEALATLAADCAAVVLEVGPGATLTQLSRQTLPRAAGHVVVASLGAGIADALGQLWCAGVAIDWAKYHAGEKRRRVVLPGYAFERKRHWVEPAAHDHSITPIHPISPIEEPAAAPPPDPAETRATRILRRLCEMLHTMSGVVIEADAAHASFVELGFDSLLLTQARQAIQSEFGVRVTFRQLFEDISNPAALAAHLGSQMPAGAPTAVKPGAPAAPIVVAAKSAAPAAQFGPFRPVAKTSDSTLTASQQEHLRDFTVRYNARTARSKAAAQKNRAVLADPRSIAGFKRAWKDLVYQLVVERSQGCRVWDIDGNEFIDVTMGFGVNFFGHAPDFVMQAVREQLEKGIHIGPQSPLAGEAAALLAELTGMDRVTFCNTGSEAVMAAMRVARCVTGRPKIVYFTGDYHGTFDEVLLRANHAGGQLRATPIAPGIPAEAGENIIILDYCADESLEIIRAHASQIAAVVVEPVQSRYPTREPLAFLRALREITHETGTLLVFDEVITGFRTHPGGCQALFGIEADLACYGKVIGGGIPIGALAGRGTILDAIDGGAWQFGDDSGPEADMTFFAGTFVRHPLALAAAVAVLRHCKERGPEMQRAMNDRTARFAGEVNAFFESEDVPLRLQHFSSLFRFFAPSDQPLLGLFFYHLAAEGLYFREAAQNCFLSTAHSDADIAEIQGAIRRSVAALREGDFLSANPGSHPLTNAQREIWLAAQLSPDACAAFNEVCTVALTGPLDVERLRAGIRLAVKRHDALRATFAPDGSSQAFAENLPIEIPLREVPDPAPILSEESRRVFDLVRGPLLAVQILALPGGVHLLVVTVHHIACDGWSSDIILRDIAAHYSARPLPEPMQFADYLRWDAEHPAGADEAWWLAQYPDAPPALDLPADFPRPAQRTWSGQRVAAHLPASIRPALHRLCVERKATLFAVLFSAFQILLQRLTGSTDIVIGIPSAAQTLCGGDELVGHCANLLPVRRRFTGEEPFTDFLAGSKAGMLDAFDHPRFTFSRLLSALALPRDPGRIPLVPVTFNLDPPLTGIDFAGLESTVAEGPRSRFQFELAFNLHDESDAILVECNFNPDLFAPATIERWLGHFRTLVESIVSGAAHPKLLTDTEREHLLALGRGPEPAYPRERCIHQLFEECARATPDAIAVEMDDARLTYRDLDERSNRLARRLRHAGANPGDLVAVCVERSPELIAGLLGILKAGCAYLPLESDLPPARIAQLLADAKPAAVLSQTTPAPQTCHSEERRISDYFPSRPENDQRFFVPQNDSVEARRGSPTIPAIPIDDDPAADSSPLPQTGATAESLAYVNYTSGSTGEPKGVLIPHRAVVRLVRGADFMHLGPDEVFLHAAAISFDASTLEIWAPLLNGGRLALLPPGDRSLTDLGRAIARHGVTTLWLTAGLFHAMVDENLEALGQLRQLLAGGDTLSPAHVKKVRDALPHLRLINGYGPTENTTFTCCHTVEEADGVSPIPIGRPIAQTQVFILDPQGRLCPIGIPGELHAGGDGLALGYLHRPDLTAGRFIPSPLDQPSPLASPAPTDSPLLGHRPLDQPSPLAFPAPPGRHNKAQGSALGLDAKTREPCKGGTTSARLYRTGDVARWRADGAIEFLGRIDRQVKIRGFRVEPGEIEAALQSVPAIAQSAVVPRADASGEKRLIAYYTPNGDEPPPVEDIRAHLGKRLPLWMLPAAFVRLDHLPLNANGKLDTSRLPAPPSAAAAESAPSHPESTLEEQLIEIWEDLLETKPIGIRDDFFALGGHSLLVARMLAGLEKRIGVRVPFSVMFESPTVAALAAWIVENQRREQDVSRSVAVQPLGDRTPFFFLHGDFSGGGFYCRDLARHIGSDRPFYALHPHGLHDEPMPPTVEAMARDFISEVRRLQPGGPYHLGGFCNGGVIAFEMARQLADAGEEIGALILLAADAENARYARLQQKAHAASERAGDDEAAKAARFRQWRAQSIERAERRRQQLKRAAKVIREPWRILAKLRRWKDSRGQPPPPPEAPWAPPPVRPVVQAYCDAMRAYVPRSLSGRASVFWPEDEPLRDLPPSLCWDAVCQEIEIVSVPGAHHSSLALKENVRIVGEHFRRVLDEADARAARSLPSR